MRDSQERALTSGDTPDQPWICTSSRSESSSAASSPAPTPPSHTSSCGTRSPWCWWTQRCNPGKRSTFHQFELLLFHQISHNKKAEEEQRSPLWSTLICPAASGFYAACLWWRGRPGPWRRQLKAAKGRRQEKVATEWKTSRKTPK